MKKSLLMTMIIAGTTILAGCANEPNEYTVEDWDSITSKASIYCVQKGNEIVRTSENDQRIIYCETSDSKKVELWEYYYQNHESERPENQTE